jgi:hypothetical protein
MPEPSPTIPNMLTTPLILSCPIDWWKGSDGDSHVPLTEIYPTEETQFKMFSTRTDNQQVRHCY